MGLDKNNKTRDINPLQVYFEEIKDIKILSPEEEVELAKRIHDGDELAREQFITANAKFVITIAKQYQHRGLELSDLINEGNIGLITAVDKFDESKKCKFVSYAVWWIRESILQGIANNGRTIRLPMHQVELIGKINTTISEFQQKYRRTPSHEEIAEILNVLDKKVSQAIVSAEKNISIDAPSMLEDDDRSLLDTYLETESKDEEESMTASIYSELINQLSNIRGEEQYVIASLLGLGCEKMTYDEISKRIELPINEIKLIRERGIRRLKMKNTSKSLRSFLDSLK